MERNHLVKEGKVVMGLGSYKGKGTGQMRWDRRLFSRSSESADAGLSILHTFTLAFSLVRYFRRERGVSLKAAKSSESGPTAARRSTPGRQAGKQLRFLLRNFLLSLFSQQLYYSTLTQVHLVRQIPETSAPL